MSVWTPDLDEQLAALVAAHPEASNAELATLLGAATGTAFTKDQVQKRRRQIAPAPSNVVDLAAYRAAKEAAFELPVARVLTPQVSYLRSLAPVPAAGAERIVCLSDTQFPFEDPTSWALDLSVIRDLRPARIYLLGDIFDGYSISRFDKDPRLGLGLAGELEYSAARLAELRAAAGPDCQIVLVPGNHEVRLTHYIQRQAPQLLGVRRGGVEVLTLPYLLGLDELGIEWHGAAPGSLSNDHLGGVVEIVPGPNRLLGTHGHYSKKSSNSLVPLVEAWDASVIGGHDHKQNEFQLTRGGVLGSPTRILRAISCGYNARRDLGYQPDGTSTWQPGFAVIERFADDTWSSDFVRIDTDRGLAIWRGQRWEVAAAAPAVAA